MFLLVAAAVGGWWWRQAGEPAGPPLPDKPSVAVLPFENPSGDERLGRLADGMAGNIIAELSKFDLFVIARGTSFGYRDKPHDARTVGRELGVRFVVEGRLEGDGKRLRTTVDLVDATSGGQAWSERYDRPLDDLFAVQDELAQRIANSIGGINGATRRALLEKARAKPPQSLQAFDLFLLARAERARDTKEANARAVELAKQAIELDPGFGRAYTLLAFLYEDQALDGFADYAAVADLWLAAATRAAELDPDSGWARLVLAQRYSMDSADFPRFASELERAADLAEGDAANMVEVAGQLPWIGRTARAVEMFERAIRLDPASIDDYRYAQRNIYFHARRFREAAAAAEALDTTDRMGMARNVMIYAQLEAPGELEQWRPRLLKEVPDWSAELYFDLNGDYPPAAAAERALVLESIAKAGLPRCATPEQLAEKPTMRRMPECEAERAKAAAVKL